MTRRGPKLVARYDTVGRVLYRAPNWYISPVGYYKPPPTSEEGRCSELARNRLRVRTKGREKYPDKTGNEFCLWGFHIV